MNALAEYENDTSSLNQMNNVIIPLISLMAAHFGVNSFTLISDLDTNSVKKIQKKASEYFLEMSHQNSVKAERSKANDRGFIILEKSQSDVSGVIKSKARLIIAIYKTEANDTRPPEFLSKLVFPSKTSAFLVLLLKSDDSSGQSTEEVSAMCFRLYRPTAQVSLKTFLAMSYGGREEPKWFWVTKEENWNFFQKETLNMSEATVTIALATRMDKNTSVDIFWHNKNSFFWKIMRDGLKFRVNILFKQLTSESMKSTARVYLSLLTSTADGLAVLPVISSDRIKYVDFILTGCDSKYHLMVKTPEYVISWQSVFKPLASESWICTGIAILLISVTLRIVTHNQKSQSLSLSSCTLTIFGFVCFQSTTHIPKSCSARLVCYTALIFSIIMYQFYISNFYSLLSTKEVKLPFTSIEEFMAKRTHKLYIHPETAIYGYLAKAPNGTFKKLWDEFLKNDPSHQLGNSERVKPLLDVCSGRGAILGLPFQTIYFKELHCELVSVNSGYFPTNVVTIIRRNFPFKSQFKFVHLRLLEAGLAHKYRDEFLNIKQQRETRTSVTNEPVCLEHVAFLFGFQAAFLILSLLMLAVEILASKTFISRKHIPAPHPLSLIVRFLKFGIKCLRDSAPIVV